MTMSNFNLTIEEYDWSERKPRPAISDLVWRVFQHVVQIEDERLAFLSADGTGFLFHHKQDCCESVGIESVVGDLADLSGAAILLAEEVSADGMPAQHPSDAEYGSFTWTFYKFATRKGYVDVRWYGTSNGYYSERVDLDRITWTT